MAVMGYKLNIDRKSRKNLTLKQDINRICNKHKASTKVKRDCKFIFQKKFKQLEVISKRILEQS